MSEFQVLGPVQLRAGGQVVDLGPPKQRAVLATLLVDAGRPVSVDLVVDRVWGEDPPAQARGALYSHIMRIRRALDRAAQSDDQRTALVRGPAGYAIEVDPDQVDLHRFRRLAEAARDNPSEDARLTTLREAVALWQGEPLAGITGDWAERMRRSWQQQYLDVVVAWAREEVRAGDPGRVCGPLRDLSRDHPLIEPLAAVLMRALAADGRTAEALECYAAVRRRLADELGADPGPELQGVHQALLHGERAAAPVPVVASPPPVDPPPVAVDPADPGDGSGEEQPAPQGRKILATLAVLVLSYLTTGLLAVRAAARAHSVNAVAAAVAVASVSVAVVTAFTVLYGRWPRRRWFSAATVAGLALVFFTVVPPLAAGKDPPEAPDSPVRATVWSARTTGPAPFFDPIGNLVQTLPANYPVQVTCQYPGNPPGTWRTNGIEDHVIVPGEGHIPDPYLTFAGAAVPKPPAGLPRCPPRTPGR